MAKIENNNFPIVAIGASAGGLEALEFFFENMPKDNGMAFVVIQHLDPTRVGLLPEILQRITTMKTLEASDGIQLAPNSIYVIPPNKSMSLFHGKLHLFEPVESRGLRLPIDFFFSSLADEMQDKSIGIILSGMGADGSEGAKAIKNKNGIILVQDPSTAKFDTMPQSAIKAVIPDIIAPVEELPIRLTAITKDFQDITKETEIDSETLINIDKIIQLLRHQSGNDFSLYKKNTIYRRIERRKIIHEIDSIKNYVQFCQENPKEVEILFKELLIGVTHFFREPAVWEKLKEDTLPNLLRSLPEGATIRAWVPACSTGEEAYSLAIIFSELMASDFENKNFNIQIFATDLDPEAIEKARKGFFSQSNVDNLSRERLHSFFTKQGTNYQITNSIRKMVIFAVQNIIKDPPFTKVDLVSCRNLLIYLEPVLQKKIISLFSYSLNTNGILLLGSAETLGEFTGFFEPIDPKLKLYKRTKLKFAHKFIYFPSTFLNTNKTKAEVTMTTTKVTENIQTLADQIILQSYAPASVLVNDSGDILYITGRTGKYLEPLAGKANWNIHAMARHGLQKELLLAFRKSTNNFQPITINNIKLENNGIPFFINVIVQRIERPEALKNMIIVIFSDAAPLQEKESAKSKTSKMGSSSQLNELEIELRSSLEELKETKEEMITSQEELKSTNEELQSTNEELQSTNEELTTSKEEMQSMNEELQTVNIELQRKIGDFEQTNTDMTNLLNSTGIATLFLDKELNIRRFTNEVSTVFKIRSSDMGRPISEIVTDLIYPEIDAHCKQVIKNLITIETIISTNDKRWYNIRIMPYRTSDNHIDGLVITFFNITVNKALELELKEANKIIQSKEKNLQHSETNYRNFFESAKEGILIIDFEDGKIRDVNSFLVQLLGYSKEQFLEKKIWDIGLFKDIIDNKDKFSELKQKEFIRYENLPIETSAGQKINVEFVSNIYSMNNQKFIQCFIREISKK